MFSTVGRYDSLVPNSPRRTAIAGAPVRAPISAATPSIAVPITVPTTIAVTAAVKESSLPGWPSTVAALVKPIRLIPRLAQSANWSLKPSVRGGAVSSVSGASGRALGAPGGRSSSADEDGEGEAAVMAILPTPALPGQVPAVSTPSPASPE
ncbi:hypothetical protein P3T34_003884 [Kitasatospora sp. MAP12-44]|nr:hypothetical protein [Kitasatospora sp. MAP12-44]